MERKNITTWSRRNVSPQRSSATTIPNFSHFLHHILFTSFSHPLPHRSTLKFLFSHYFNNIGNIGLLKFGCFRLIFRVLQRSSVSIYSLADFLRSGTSQSKFLTKNFSPTSQISFRNSYSSHTYFNNTQSSGRIALHHETDVPSPHHVHLFKTHAIQPSFHVFLPSFIILYFTTLIFNYIVWKAPSTLDAWVK